MTDCPLLPPPRTMSMVASKNDLRYTADDMRGYATTIAAAAVLAEREACAKVCENLTLAYPGHADMTADQCAAAIRARKGTE